MLRPARNANSDETINFAGRAKYWRTSLFKNVARVFVCPGRARRGLGDDSGVSAVEFALVLPVFITLLFGVIVSATIEAIYIGTQELVSEAARASVAGLSDSERAQIVSSFISANITSYAFLDPTRISVSSSTISTTPSTYQVNLTYDMSSSFVYEFSNLIPLPSPTVQRTAVVLNGGA
jgi:Flp pilus assembly protein TadG